jgi:membrane protein required for colicin V production
VSGYRRGLIRSVFGVVALFFGMLLALKYSYFLSEYFFHREFIQSKYLPLISFFLIFFTVLFIVNLLSVFFEKAATTLFLGTINKIIGGILWASLMILLFSTVLWFVDQMHFIDLTVKQRSKTYPYLISLSPLLIDQISQAMPYFRGMFDILEKFFYQNSEPSKGIQVML